jgi:hypothetical protein
MLPWPRHTRARATLGAEDAPHVELEILGRQLDEAKVHVEVVQRHWTACCARLASRVGGMGEGEMRRGEEGRESDAATHRSRS